MLFYQKFIGPTIDATRNEQATSPSKQANASSIWIMRDENAIETELERNQAVNRFESFSFGGH